MVSDTPRPSSTAPANSQMPANTQAQNRVSVLLPTCTRVSVVPTLTPHSGQDDSGDTLHGMTRTQMHMRQTDGIHTLSASQRRLASGQERTDVAKELATSLAPMPYAMKTHRKAPACARHDEGLLPRHWHVLYPCHAMTGTARALLTRLGVLATARAVRETLGARGTACSKLDIFKAWSIARLCECSRAGHQQSMHQPTRREYALADSAWRRAAGVARRTVPCTGESLLPRVTSCCALISK